jgi:hypothetical protein
MPNQKEPPFFRCPNCNALYQVVRAKAGPETVDLEAASGMCGEALVAREGQFVLKYYLLRKAIREDSRTGRGSKRARSTNASKFGSSASSIWRNSSGARRKLAATESQNLSTTSWPL